MNNLARALLFRARKALAGRSIQRAPKFPIDRELQEWPTPALNAFRLAVADAFERARSADDRPACDAALRLIGRVESELASRR